MNAITEYAAKIDDLAKALLESHEPLMMAAGVEADAIKARKDCERFYKVEASAAILNETMKDKGGKINGRNQSIRDKQECVFLEELKYTEGSALSMA